MYFYIYQMCLSNNKKENSESEIHKIYHKTLVLTFITLTWLWYYWTLELWRKPIHKLKNQMEAIVI